MTDKIFDTPKAIILQDNDSSLLPMTHQPLLMPKIGHRASSLSEHISKFSETGNDLTSEFLVTRTIDNHGKQPFLNPSKQFSDQPSKREDDLLGQDWGVSKHTLSLDTSVLSKDSDASLHNNSLNDQHLSPLQTTATAPTPIEMVMDGYFSNIGQDSWLSESIDRKWDRISGESAQFPNGNFTDGDLWQADVPPGIYSIYEQLSTAIFGTVNSVNSGYLYDQGYYDFFGKWHGGLDIQASQGTLVKVAVDGVVAWQNDDFIGIDSDDGNHWVYGHLGEKYVQTGQRINAGQSLAKTDPENHLHLEVQQGHGYKQTLGAHVDQNWLRDVTISPLQAYWSHTASTQLPAESEAFWDIRFINRTVDNVADYNSYDFNNPANIDTVYNSTTGPTLAELSLNYGNTAPQTNVQSDYFALQASTRLNLETGKFYHISTDSDDGVRFFFKDTLTGNVIQELDGDWRDRSVSEPTSGHLIQVTETGAYDFYVQYYEAVGASTVDIRIEEVTPLGQGQLAAGWTSLNLREGPSVHTADIGDVGKDEQFTVIEQVSPNGIDRWYKIQTSDNQIGYIANFFNDQDYTQIIPGSTPDSILMSPDHNCGAIVPDAGVVSGLRAMAGGSPNGSLSFRPAPTTNSTPYANRVEAGTPVTILEKVTGGSYEDAFDQWYRVSVTINGQEQEGYIAAYYVDAPTSGCDFNTFISKDSAAYLPHLNEVINPEYFSQSYQPFIEEAADLYDWLEPSVLAGIGSRESIWGRILSPPGPAGTGDNGHGRGLMQIDDRFHSDFIDSGQWSDPRANILYAAEVLSNSRNYIAQRTDLTGYDLLRAAIAGYNAGPAYVVDAIKNGWDVDYYTTGDDYSWDVLNRAGWFQLHGWA